MVLNRFFECLVLRPPDLYCSSCSHACRLLGGVAGVWWPYGFGVEFILIAGGDVLPGVGGSWSGVAGPGGFDICSCMGFGRGCRTGRQPLRFPNI